MTDEKQDQSPWERSVDCPHCDKKFWIKVKLTLTELKSTTEPEDADSITKWKNGLEPAELKRIFLGPFANPRVEIKNRR
jgi:hypothetical protein